MNGYGKPAMSLASQYSSSPIAVKLRRNQRPIGIALVVLLVLWVFSWPRRPGGLNSGALPRQAQARYVSYFSSNASLSHPSPKAPEALEFWRSFTDTIAKGKPSFEEIKRKNKDVPWVTFDRSHQDSKRPDNLEVTQEQVDELKKLRKQMIAEIGELADKLPFARGTRGLVTTASNDALAILTTSLWMLRATGSQLPVEIWLEDDHNWEDEPCKDIFPALGAQCMLMTDYMPSDLAHRPHIAKFTYKGLAMAFTTFEHFLFLDCDAFPVMNPDSIFETEPFISKGWVLWPDYWASTASKALYEIVGRKEPDLKEKPTTESGEMVINKATHAAPLLLSVWYNVYGPGLWHRLLSQAAPGEGDKDTYLVAIQDYGLSWYQVYEEPQRIGYRCNNKQRAIGSAHSHPFDDYRISSNGIIRHSKGFDLNEAPHPRVLFIHGNLPKLDPYILLDWDMPKLDWRDMLRCDEGRGPVHRLFGPKELTVVKYGWDIERAIWDALRWEACVHEKGYGFWTIGSIWRPTESLRQDLCPKITVLWQALFPDEIWKPIVPKMGVGLERPWGGWDLPLSS